MNALADGFRATRYSQFGEDGVLGWLFHGRRDGFYVDVGCHHPYRFSNTAMLHDDHGWTGINIDVDERATAAFRIARPNDINLTMGIAGEPGRRTVTIFDEGAINSFDDEAAAHPAWDHIPRVRQEVEVRPLGAVLHDLMPAGRTITLLNIDAEGLDVEILASNDWSAFRPEAITVEVHNFDPNDPETNQTFRFLRQQGYRLISHVALTSIYQLPAPAAPAAITNEEVRWLYRCFLGRDPESPETVEWFKGVVGTFDGGRHALCCSAEFRVKNPDAVREYYIPERFPKPFVKSKKRLCLAMIVKNEAKYIAKMLRSCAPILDLVVIVDTGSTDETMALVRQTMIDLSVPYILDHEPFVNFAQSRNAVLGRVPDDMDWVLMLDADEELVEADYPRFAALLEATDTDAWLIPRYTFVDFAKRKPVTTYPDFQLRLFRNRPTDPVRFTGAVHEKPNISGRLAPVSKCEDDIVGGPHIHHLGFIEITHEDWQKKHDFYTKLLHG